MGAAINMTPGRFKAALACYGLLALVAAVLLEDRRFLIAVLVVLAGLTVMSVTAYLRERYDREE